MLAPEALGYEACNKDQWNLRTFDLHERIGAISDAGSFSRDGRFTAPPGFQYRSLEQYSVWGEQPSPEETERMMMETDENVYLSASGYITRKVDHLKEEEEEEEEEEEKNPDEQEKEKEKDKKKKKKKNLGALALHEE